MSSVTLLTKTYNNFQPKTIEKFLKPKLEGLRASTKICGVTSRGWVQIAISGEDETAALHYLANEIGLCPTDLKLVNKFSTIKGRVTALNKSKDAIYIDIGVSSPKIVDATIPLQHLQAQLVDGRKAALKKLTELFGFCENLPLHVKICDIDREKGYIEAMLSLNQLKQYEYWMKSLLDRLTILGASCEEVRFALKMAGCNRDVVGIEPLGIFEHYIVCKLGTDAAGLVPKIGKRLRNATFSIFNPREILGFLEKTASPKTTITV